MKKHPPDAGGAAILPQAREMVPFAAAPPGSGPSPGPSQFEIEGFRSAGA